VTAELSKSVESLPEENARLRAELNEALLNLKKISEEEFLRRALSQELQYGPDTLTPIGRMLRGLRTDRDEALAKLKSLRADFKPYLQHLGFCCRGLPSAGRPCNCGVFELMGPLSEDQWERRREHADMGPFPDTAQIAAWVKRSNE
jgi:hypothetical protein